ncbi:TPA: multidrug ABC transporter substrate-binding protein [Candidatus Peregrinibacteria bacterium]|nr:multidrug ABC transporter substrate-binding protein [Candidatus Peregrinibacteria bacterium]
MRIHDLFGQTWASIEANKARSSLTILGIVIGIASVIIMLSIGQGAQSSVQDSIESIGTNLLTISPGASKGSSGLSMVQGTSETLTENDINLVQSYLPSLAGITKISSGKYQAVVTGGTNTNASVYGVDSDYQEVKEVEMLQGRFFASDDEDSLSKVAVLGYGVYEDLFGANGINVLNQQVEINEVNFRIVGVVQETGVTEDNLIYAPITTVQHYLTGSNSLSSVIVKTEEGDDITVVKTAIEDILRFSHGIGADDDDDFSVTEPSSFLETASEITGVFTILLACIAGISLVVGGIGIMNMMLTTVSERTREIGVRKSIGATEFDINMQFLLESLLLTLIGGLLGLGIGIAIAKIISGLGLVTTVITPSSVMLAVGVSSFIGVIFGYYPAQKASRLDPIEALRHE